MEEGDDADALACAGDKRRSVFKPRPGALCGLAARLGQHLAADQDITRNRKAGKRALRRARRIWKRGI